jgi:hypothetical protein
METLQKNMQSEDDPVDDRNHLTNMNTTNVKKTNPVIRRLQPTSQSEIVAKLPQ